MAIIPLPLDGVFIHNYEGIVLYILIHVCMQSSVYNLVDSYHNYVDSVKIPVCKDIYQQVKNLTYC